MRFRLVSSLNSYGVLPSIESGSRPKFFFEKSSNHIPLNVSFATTFSKPSIILEHPRTTLHEDLKRQTFDLESRRSQRRSQQLHSVHTRSVQCPTCPTRRVNGSKPLSLLPRSCRVFNAQNHRQHFDRKRELSRLRHPLVRRRRRGSMPLQPRPVRGHDRPFRSRVRVNHRVKMKGEPHPRRKRLA